MSAAEVDERTIRKAENIIQDSRLAVVVGLIPILSLIYILRLVQWYVVRNQNPELLSPDSPQPRLARNDRQALSGCGSRFCSGRRSSASS